jgi:hypothetical protein
LMFYSQLDEGRQGKYTFSGNADIGMGQSWRVWPNQGQ